MSSLPSWVPNIDDEVSVTRLRRSIWLVLALGFLAFIARGADRPDDPAFADAFRPRVPVAGLAEIAVAFVDVAGSVVEHCMLLAETPEQQQRGLTGVSELVGYGGLLYRFPQPTEAPVSAGATTLPLSIAFFDEGGVLVGAGEVPPCPVGAPTCPAAPPPGAPFSYALAVEQGTLVPLGVELRVRLELRGACPA